jgi:hypothetical protein
MIIKHNRMQTIKITRMGLLRPKRVRKRSPIWANGKSGYKNGTFRVNTQFSSRGGKWNIEKGWLYPGTQYCFQEEKWNCEKRQHFSEPPNVFLTVGNSET